MGSWQASPIPHDRVDRDQLIDAGIGKGLKPAGTGGYSTTNYILLQEVAEEITGTSLQDLIAKRITGPLGMANSALPPNEDTTLPEPAAHGYLNSNCIAEVEADGGNATEGQDTTDGTPPTARAVAACRPRSPISAGRAPPGWATPSWRATAASA